MPLNRYLIRNEYNLADPELYKSADKDDPEALLEGVAMAGLVGVLRQLGDLAEFAAEIFHDLHEEVMATAARGHDLVVRVQQLEAEFPPMEKSLLSQTNHTAFLYNPGFDWHSKVHMDENLVTQCDLPRFVMDNYEESRGPPRLFLLDKFDVAGAGACLKRYTDPSFIKVESSDSNTQKPEGKREKRFRKVKRRGTRWKIGDTPEIAPSSHAKLHQLLLEERIETGAQDPERRVKLKKRALDRFECNEESRKSYMMKFLDTCLPAHKVVHEISMDLVPWSAESNISCHSGLEIVKYDALSPCEEPLERDKLAYPPCGFPEVEKYSINEFNEVTDSKILEKEKDHEDDAGKILLMLSKEVEEEELAAVDSFQKSEVGVREYHSDVVSETDNFLDALATVDFDINIDSNSRLTREPHNLKIRQLDSDGSEELYGPQNPLDYHSVGNSTVSDDGSLVNKERGAFSCYDTASCVAESVQEINGYVAAKSSALVDQPSDHQNKSLVIQSYQKHDHVAGDTLENSDEKMIGQSEFDGRCLNSAKRRRGFAKIELKWVKRSGDGDVSHKNSMTCSISSAEDELQMPDRLLSLSQTDAAKDDSAPHSFERVKNSWSSVSSHSDESFGVVDLPMDETSTDAALVVNTASVSSLTNTEPAHMDLKDANMSSPEEQSQNLYSLVDLAHRSEKAETRISGVVDAGLQSQFDVAEEVVPCCGGDPNISLVSKANNGELMNESSFSTHTDGGETMDFKSCLGTGGPGIMGGTPGVDYTEMQSPGVPGYSKECLVEIKANKTSEVDYLEVGEGDAYEPAQLMVSGVGREADPETADVPLLVEEHTAETGILISQNMEEMPQELVVEEAESSLSTESTDSSSASPTAYLDHQLKLKPKSRGDARLNGGLNEAAQKDPRVSVDEYDGQEVMNAGGEFPILSSTHSIGSLSVLEEEKPFTADQTASATMCVEAVVATTQDDNIKDEKTVAVPLSSLMDQPTSFCDRGHEESPCFEVHSYQNEEVSQTLPLKPLQEDMNHTADIWYELDQSAPSHPHEQEQGSPFKDGSYQNEEACETLPLKAETEMEFQEGSSHVADVSLSSSSHYGMTLHDNFCRSSDTAPNPFLPSDRQDSFYSADGSDIDTATKSAVNLGQVLEPHVGNMVFSEQTDAGRLENPPAIKPSTSVTAPTSMLPDLIQGSQNTEITAQLISPLFPTLGVIPDLSNIKLDEMPPPPPLPPMQWRLGKSQQHASSVLYPGAVQSESDFSAAVLPTNNNADIRSPDPAGSQSWNPFMSCSSEDNQPKHFEDHLERSVELDSLDRVHDQSEQNLFQMAQPLDSQSHATCQDDLQPSDPGSMSLPGRVSSENDLFIEVSIQHTSASGGNGVIKEEMAVEDDKLPCVSSAVEEERGIEASPELVDASIKEKVIKFETDDQLPVISSADEQERTVLHEQLEHVSLVMEQGAVNPSSQFKQEIGAEGEKLELVPSAVEQERAIKASSEHTDPSGTKKVIKPETDVQDGKHPDIFAVGEQEQAILDKQLEDFSSVTEQRTDNPSSEFKEIAVQDEKLQLVSSEVVQEKAIKASSEVTDTFDEEKVIKVLIDVHDEKLSDISAAVEQDVSILDKQLEHVSLVTEQGTGISSSQFEEIAVQDEKLQLVSSDVVQARAIEASSEHTDAAYGEKLMKPEIDQVEELSDISAAAEQERVVRDEQLNYVLSVEQGTVNSSTQSKQEIAVQDEKLKHVLPPVELKRATEASSKHTDESNTEKVINQETDVQDDKLSDISPAEEQERVTRGEQLEHVSSAMGLGTVNLSRESNFPVSTKQGHLAQPGFISPEDQEAWSTNAFATIEPGNRNGDMQKKAPRPRNPLIDAVVAVDRSKLRKVGEISKSQDKLRAKEREQNLPQLRKVGERVKPRDGSRTEENIRNLPRLRRVEERTKPKDIPKSEGKELSLPQLRKVGDKVKSPGEAKSEGREQSLPQLRKVGGRVKHQDKVRSEEREQGLPRLRKVGERFKPRDESKSEEEKKSRLPALRKVEEIGDTQNESTSEEREQNISLLPKSGERVKQQAGSIADDRDSLMEQIRNKTFSLKPAVATRTNMPGPQTNLKVAAILQKANIIRQAMAGSDEDSDGWSDN